MKEVLVSFKKKFVRIFLSFVIVLPVILFLNTGFLIDPYWKIFQAFIFVFVFTIVFVWPQFRKAIFRLSLLLIIMMSFLYIVRLIEWADMAGSSAFGFLLINLISY